MKVILDARDCPDVPTLALFFAEQCVVGAHTCPQEIWVNPAIEDQLIENWLRQHPGVQYPHRFKTIPVRCSYR